ncbi:MAG: type II toxin-antitoxin system PemK/MazF family toxin [Gemmatimonadaceae bacterium]|nr:type II toxin-antitoxin system PemK/MazF family toxin [Gemmatimonadaceae bacterium]
MAVTPRRGDVVLVALEPIRSREIRKTRPCVIVSPDELNRHLRTVIVAPMTTGGQAYPWRIACRFQQSDGFIAIDQLRTIGRERLNRKLGRLAPVALGAMLVLLQEMFAP